MLKLNRLSFYFFTDPFKVIDWKGRRCVNFNDPIVPLCRTLLLVVLLYEDIRYVMIPKRRQ